MELLRFVYVYLFTINDAVFLL